MAIPQPLRCIYSAIFDDRRYYCTRSNLWHVCRSPYCRVHGLRTRRNLSNRLQGLFAGGWDYACVTIYPGLILSSERRQRFFKRYRRLLQARYFPIVIHRVTHWKYGLPNWHMTIATTKPVSRRFHKLCVTQSLSSVQIENASRKRVGFAHEVKPHAWFNYCLRTHGRYEQLPWNEMPPLGVRREMTRMPSRSDRDWLSVMEYSLYGAKWLASLTSGEAEEPTYLEIEDESQRY